MGNITNLQRWGNAGVKMDSLSYKYSTLNGNLASNKLFAVRDNVASANYTDDIDNQKDINNDPYYKNFKNNYAYDELGNLKKDSAEGIQNIEWTVYGKIKKVTRYSTSTKPDLEFVYDASGNRICKIVKPKPLSVATYKYSYYLRDAQGNEMANYELNMLNTTTVKDLTVTARPIYGSSRLGIDSRRVILWQNGTNVSIDTPTVIKNRILSLKQYELSNHLGNVLVTVSDKRIAKSYGGGSVDYFEPEITTISDYYAFGSPMPTRTWSDPNAKYKYGFNGKEKDNETTVDGGDYDFGARIYDSRLGRWMAMDPLSKSYPELSPYNGCGNNPIIFIDKEGKFIIAEHIKAAYPNLEAAIAIVYKAVENLSDEKIAEICRIGGFVDRQDILTLLSPASGPILDVKDITNFISSNEAEKTVEGGKLGVNAGGEAVTNGEGGKPVSQITVTLDEAVANFLDQTTNNSDGRTTPYRIQLFLHELTHVRQILNGEMINETQAYTIEKLASGRKSIEFRYFGWKYESTPPSPSTHNVESLKQFISTSSESSSSNQNDQDFIGPPKPPSQNTDEKESPSN